jgi:alcohol dehydrogenase
MYVGNEKVEWRETPDPELSHSTDAIVRPVAATTCDLDEVIIKGRSPLKPPFAIGHECVAQVVSIGEDVDHVVPGDLVIVPWHIACGRCDRCEAGLFAHCTEVPYLAMFGAPIGGDWGGLFSDLVKIPYADKMLVPLPDGLDPIAMAAASDNYPLAWRLVAPHLKNKPGASVLVISRGSIGLYVCDIAKALGAGRVVFVDQSEENRKIAESFGAETLAEIEPVHHGFDISIEAGGSVEALKTALTSLVPEGMCESAGNHYKPGETPLLQMYLNGVTFRVGRDNVRANIPPALELAASGKVDPGRVVSHVFDWEELPTELPKGHNKAVFVREPVKLPSV